MNHYKTFITVALLALTSASAAYAAPKVLASAPAVLTGLNTLYCDVTNIDPVNPIDVTGEVMDIDGVVVPGTTQTITIAPGTGQFFAGTATPGAAWCRFTVNGSTKYLRAMAIYDDGTSYTVNLPAY